MPKQKRPKPPQKPSEQREHDLRESALDKTLADSFPTSDPPSTIPDPADEDTTGADDPRYTSGNGRL